MADGKLDISETGKNTQVPAVEFKNVCLKYAGGGEEALTDINFSVMPGETVGVIGGTGSGKSSLVNMIHVWFPLRRCAAEDIHRNPFRNLSNLEVFPRQTVLRIMQCLSTASVRI